MFCVRASKRCYLSFVLILDFEWHANNVKLETSFCLFQCSSSSNSALVCHLLLLLPIIYPFITSTSLLDLNQEIRFVYFCK
jgi:hypothetical protein